MQQVWYESTLVSRARVWYPQESDRSLGLSPGLRSSRLVNPDALARGTVFVQCATETCAVWHKITDAYGFYGQEYTGLQSGDVDSEGDGTGQ